MRDSLLTKTYCHGSYKPFYVYDPKLRHIHKASVRDRVVHQAVFRILYPIFDKTFIFDSYSCRVAKGTHAAIRRLETFTLRANRNYTSPLFYLKCDIKKYFTNIDHCILLALIQRKITDQNTLWLIKEILFSFAKRSGKGLPLGNVTSQLFANIYLNELDYFVKHELRRRYYIRYCDDFIILNQSEDYLRELILVISNFLESKLHISLHPHKIIVRKFRRGIDFLGYVTLPYYRVVRTKTKRRMLRLVSENNLSSYLGVCRHAYARMLESELEQRAGKRHIFSSAGPDIRC